MRKIGFIDYYIDEWHANNYPKIIRESSFKNKFDVVMAWEETTKEGKRNIDEWCREQKVQKASSIEEIVKECDCIVVLSPDNAERHEDLSDLPLRSGKPVYIDKPIAPTLAIAKQLFEKAEKHSTPIMSSSALRFGSKLREALKNKIGNLPIHFVASRGGGVFNIYAIHQLEMLVMALGTGAKQVMQCGNKQSKLMIIAYDDERRGIINLTPGQPFGITIQYGKDQGLVVGEMNDYFPCFIEAMLRFFNTGISMIPKEETLEIAALIEAGSAALTSQDTWVEVPTK